MKKTEGKSVYILLTDTGTLFTKTVKQYTRVPYNHTSLSFDLKLEELYSFGRKQPKNPLKAGFIKEDIYRGTFSHFRNTRCVLFKLNVSERQFGEMRRMVLSFQMRSEMYSYNLIGLFGIIINYPIETENAYFCSQFVAEVLKRGGIQLWDKSSALVTPREFLEHTSFHKIYEGKLYDYPLLQSKLLVGYRPRNRKRKLWVFPGKEISR
ncbi:MAG TPA: hypothetical protein VFK33_03025 [Bacillales bacterium]|nr:hypothetical protein [Bacillales bacterium]